MFDGKRLAAGKGGGGVGKGNSSASSKSSSASTARASKTPQRAENKSQLTNPSPASAPRVDRVPQSAGKGSRSTSPSSASAPRASKTPQRTENKSQLTNSSSASAQRRQNSSRFRGSRSASRSRLKERKTRKMEKGKQNENKPLTNCPRLDKLTNFKCVPFCPISKPRLIPKRVIALSALPRTAVSQLSTDNNEIYIRDVPNPVTSSGTRSDLVHPATATCASTSDPILANIKGPLTVWTRRRMGRLSQSGDIFVEETIDILGVNDPSATVEQVNGRPIQQGARDLKVNNDNDKNSPTVGGGAVIAAGIAQLQFVVQLPSQGPLDFTWDQQFTTAQDAQPIPVDFTQRPLEAQSINAMAKNDFTGPVNIALHLNSTRGEETPITTIIQTTAQSSQPQAAPSSKSNVPSSANTIIRNAIEIRFGESKALPTTELRKKVPSLTKSLGHPQIRERVFFGDGVIRLDRDMLIRPEDGVEEMKEDVRTYDFVPPTHLAVGERRFSMAPYSDLSGFPSLLNIHGERARTRSPIVTARVSTGSTESSSSTSSLATAIPYRADSSMNGTSMCSTASAPSVQTRESSLSATSGRSSRSKLQTAPSNQQKVSVRTGVSMNRLERTQSIPPPSASRQQRTKTSTEVSSLESFATVTAQSPSSELSGSASITLDSTQSSMTASCKTPPRGQGSTPMLGRYTPPTDSTPRTSNSMSTPSSTETARSIDRNTPQFRKQSQATPIRSQTVATPRYSSYRTDQGQASARRPHRGVTQSAGNRSDHGHKSTSKKSSKTSRSWRHPTALDIIDDEGMIKRGNTHAKPATDSSVTHSTSVNRMARKARSCRKRFNPASNTTSRDLNATLHATTNFNGIPASALSATGIEATTMIEEPVNRLAKPCYRREPHRKCRGCGKSLIQKKKSTASAAQNPSMQMLETNGGGLRFKVKMRLDVSELLKQKKMSSSKPSTSASSRSNKTGASAVVWLPLEVSIEKATIIGIPPNSDPSK